MGRRPPSEDAKQAIIAVGDGRGFIVAAPNDRFGHLYVVTAAHCLPHLPPAHPWSYLEERTYADLVGPLGEKKGVWAECVFADPVADIAVLTGPDGQELYEQGEAWERFVEARPGFRSRAPNAEASPGYMLSLDNEWLPCRLRAHRDGGSLTVLEGSPDIQAGMSGSPIVDGAGSAVGVVSTSSILSSGGAQDAHLQPCLSSHLPGWLIRRFGIEAAHLTSRR